MMKVFKFRNHKEIREQASEWIMRLEDPDIEECVIGSFMAWLDESPEHRTEFIALVSIWGKMDILSELADIPLEEPLPKRKDWGMFNVSGSPAFAIAASVCIAISLGFYVAKDKLWPAFSETSTTQVVYKTSVGDQNSIDLEDGSYIKLNTDSKVSIDYSGKSREIYLERGEAHFEVAHDPQRLFIVHVGDGSVTAKGTAFTVQYHNSLVGVTVTDGTVEVDTGLTEEAIAVLTSSPSREKRKPTKMSVSAGQTVEFDEVIRFVETVAAEAMDRKLAWQRGMLIFDGDYLEDAIIEIARYTNKKIVINDEAIRKIQIGGYFRTGEIDAMLRAFESSFGIAVTRVDENLIHLSKKPSFLTE